MPNHIPQVPKQHENVEEVSDMHVIYRKWCNYSKLVFYTLKILLEFQFRCQSVIELKLSKSVQQLCDKYKLHFSNL